MRKPFLRALPAVDFLLLPFVYLAAFLLKFIRRLSIERMPRAMNAFVKVGVYPILDHYYEPQFCHSAPLREFCEDRDLPAIDWNVIGQLEMLQQFEFSAELANIPQEKPNDLGFYLNNGSFESGDAEVWYQFVRTLKPKRIIEIGSGNSTLMAIDAIEKNQQDDRDYRCEHVCIEPYEMPWLEQSGVVVVRERVETLEMSFFSQLEENDILFIDSSHMIRPQGDVVFEILELLPSLKKGVIVHLHDIFSPKNYPKQWLQDQVRFWNEQYLLEAFLSHNESWEILAALNYLHHNHYERLKSVAPQLTPAREPGSFYIRRTA
jgi:predicted O-methyltransferase YrrM